VHLPLWCCNNLNEILHLQRKFLLSNYHSLIDFGRVIPYSSNPGHLIILTGNFERVEPSQGDETRCSQFDTGPEASRMGD